MQLLWAIFSLTEGTEKILRWMVPFIDSCCIMVKGRLATSLDHLFLHNKIREARNAWCEVHTHATYLWYNITASKDPLHMQQRDYTCMCGSLPQRLLCYAYTEWIITVSCITCTHICTQNYITCCKCLLRETLNTRKFLNILIKPVQTRWASK